MAATNGANVFCFLSSLPFYIQPSVVGPPNEAEPKARGLAQHSGPPCWLEDSDPVGVILYVIDGPYRLPFPSRVILYVIDGPYRLPFPYCTGSPDKSCPAASWWNFQQLLHNQTTWVLSTSHKRHGRVLNCGRPMPSLWPYNLHAISLLLTNTVLPNHMKGKVSWDSRRRLRAS